MQKGSLWAVYFSPTGTTKTVVCHIARHLSDALGMPLREFDFTLPAARAGELAFGADDLVVFGTPVYAGRVPNVLVKYFNQIRGNGALGVPISVFGNRNFDNALIELRNLLETCGLHTVAAGAFVGEHSFSKTLGAGRPDAEDLTLVTDFAARIAAAIENHTAVSPVTVPGADPLPPYYMPRDDNGNPIDIRKAKSKAGDACVGCGLCARVCPMGSIDPADVRNSLGICIKCGACSKKCPVGARYFDDEGYLYHKRDLEEKYARRAEPSVFI